MNKRRKKGFDTKHYNEVKKFFLHLISHHSVLYTGTHEDWIKGMLPLISQSIHSEDYEAAQACRDALKEYLKSIDPTIEIPEDALIKIPDHKP